MGNERTLALIAEAATRLARIDPDYAARMKTNRIEHRLRLRDNRARKANREITTALRKVRISVDESDLVSIDFAMIEHQYDDLFDLEAKDTGRALATRTVDTTASRQLMPKLPKGKLYKIGNQEMTVRQWAETANIAIASIYTRLSAGWTFEKAVRVHIWSVMGWSSHKSRVGDRVETSSDTLRTGDLGSPDSLPKQDIFQ